MCSKNVIVFSVFLTEGQLTCEEVGVRKDIKEAQVKCYCDFIDGFQCCRRLNFCCCDI